MARLAWASLRAHPLRLLATALSVVLGIAFVSGTFVLTDTVQAAFDELFGSSAGVNVAVRAVPAFEAESLNGGRPGVPDDLLPTIDALPGVAAIDPRYSGLAQLVDSDGEPLGGENAPTTGTGAPAAGALAGVELQSGRFPEAAGEVAIDGASAETLGRALGDAVGVSLNAPAREFTVVGTVSLPGVEGSGATLTVFHPETAKALYGAEGADQVAVLAAGGLDNVTLRDRISAAVGPEFEAVTGEELASEAASQVGEYLGFLTRGLLIFAGAALLVGAVIILNTFAITVAQRTRELALLQAVGADAPQVFRMVLTEAAAVGLVGAAVGVAAGVIVAAGLRALLDAADVPLPSAALVLAPRTVVIGLVVGPAVTLLAAIGPALRASRVAPVEALRMGAVPSDGRIGGFRLALGALLALAGVAALVAAAQGLAGQAGPWLIGGGAFSGGIAVILLGPMLMAPVARVLGEPVKMARGLPGRLARHNAIRNPRRTGATAAALVIGLGLVCFALIFMASLRASVEAVIENRFLADFQVQSSGPGGFPDAAADALRAVPGVETVSAAKFSAAGVNGSARPLLAIDPATFLSTFALDVNQGSLDGLDRDGAALAGSLLTDLGLSVGDTVEVTFVPGQPPQALQIVATYDAVTLPGGEEAARVLVSAERYAEALPVVPDSVAFVRLAGGADPAALRPGLEEALAQYPGALLVDGAQIRGQIAEQTNQLLGLVFGLLLLSALVALVGVVNILGLSVLERTRELGLLQAVGMTREQVRQMVRLESVIIALLGGTLGLGLGTAFAWLVVRVLRDSGLEVFQVPVGQMAAAVAVSGLVGVLASVIPAWRASQVDVLRALHVE
ncbi:MAG: FtsX-like permease family protein [Nitriliruptorales bacterium]|nr:FtsX-like permease family protein [Nitriliruptorales bacterium]